VFLTLALDGDGIVSFTPQPLYSWGKAHGIHWSRVWVGPRGGVNALAKKQFPAPAGNVVQPVA